MVLTVKFNYNQQSRSQITPLLPVSWSRGSLVFGLLVVELKVWPWKIWVRDKITRPMYISKRINPLLIWIVYILCAAVWLTILSITLGSIEPTATIAENTTLATAGPLYTVAFKSEPSNNKNNNNGKSNGNIGSPVAKGKWDSYGSSSLVSFCGWCLLFSATTVSLHIVAWWRHVSAQSSTEFGIYSTPVIWKREINLVPRVLSYPSLGIERETGRRENLGTTLARDLGVRATLLLEKTDLSISLPSFRLQENMSII